MINLSWYQEEDREILKTHQRWGLFNEMGTGKTYPAIAAADDIGGQVLITVPAYLIPTWTQAIRDYMPPRAGLVDVATGSRLERAHVLSESRAQFVLTSYNNWTRYPEIGQRHWSTLIFDEAHRLRGRNSLWTKEVLRTQNAASINYRSRFWWLTGTPIVRDPGDVFVFLKMMDRRIHTSYWKFVEEWCEVRETPWARNIIGLKQGYEEKFRSLLDTYSTRRLLKDIPELASLEVIGPKVIPVHLPPSVYASMRKAKKEWVLEHPDLDEPETMNSGSQLVHRLRKMSTCPPTQQKPVIDTTIGLLEDHQEPVIVWAWYRDSADALMKAISRATKRSIYLVTGDTPAALRFAAVQSWEGSKDGVLVATIAALKEGANLQHSACQIFTEVSDLPTDNDQAIGRSKRRGQDRPVRVYAVVPTDTISEKTFRNAQVRLVSTRRALLEEIREEVSGT